MRGASCAPRRARPRAGARRGGGRSPRPWDRARARVRLHARARRRAPRVARRERLEPVLLLARDAQRRPARDEHAHARHAPRTALTAGAASRRCSKLSRRRSSSLPRRNPVRSSGAPIVCATSESRSSGSESPTSGTQNTPSRCVPTSSAATCSASRVFPVPPGPVSVSRRVPSESIATSSSTSRSLPTSGLEATGRLVASSVRSGGKSPSPSWYRRSAWTRSFSRCSPRSRIAASLSSSLRVVSERTI